MDDETSDRIGALEDELKERDARIKELKADLDEARTLASAMEEQVQDAGEVIEAWKEAFEMRLADGADGPNPEAGLGRDGAQRKSLAFLVEPQDFRALLVARRQGTASGSGRHHGIVAGNEPIPVAQELGVPLHQGVVPLHEWVPSPLAVVPSTPAVDIAGAALRCSTRRANYSRAGNATVWPMRANRNPRATGGDLAGSRHHRVGGDQSLRMAQTMRAAAWLKTR
jgi:hypothetical protein